MDKIVGVILNNEDRPEYYYTNNLKINNNINVIIEQEDVLRFGKVVSEIHQIDSNKLNKKLNKIIRIASKQDYHTNQKNINDAKKALNKCNSLIKEYKLDMKILDCYFTHDREQLVFKFISDNRIDFRDLAKDLATIYHTRIELRQIGVRDKAKKIGGIGSCGQKLCCSRFLNEFDSVSIQMAKNQNLALNPSKINGLCGRLLCCLNYENDCYKECKKKLPKVGDKIKTSTGKEGQVISIDILNQKYKVQTQIGIEEEKVGSN